MRAATEQRRVSVLGLGPMGARIAAVLLEGGCEVRVWNRTQSRARPLVAAGAKASASAAAALAASPVTVAVLADTVTLAGVLEGADAALRGRLLVNLAAGTPEQAERLSGWVGERGGSYLDGRIGSYPRRIGGAKSNIVCSGRREYFERALPLLCLAGRDTRFVGERVGAANALSTSMATVFHHVALVGFLEAAALADRYGLPVEEWLSMAKPMLELTADAIEHVGELCARGDYQAGEAAIGTHARTIEVAVEAMADLGAERGLAEATLAQLRQAEADGLGGADIAALFDQMRRRQDATPSGAG